MNDFKYKPKHMVVKKKKYTYIAERASVNFVGAVTFSRPPFDLKGGFYEWQLVSKGENLPSNVFLLSSTETIPPEITASKIFL